MILDHAVQDREYPERQPGLRLLQEAREGQGGQKGADQPAGEHPSADAAEQTATPLLQVGRRGEFPTIHLR